MANRHHTAAVTSTAANECSELITNNSKSFILQSFAGQQGVAYRHYYCLPYLRNFRTRPAKSPKIAVVDNQQSRLMPPPSGTPTNIRMNLIFPETRVIGLHLCRRLYGPIFIQICAMCSKSRIFAATESLPKTDFDGK